MGPNPGHGLICFVSNIPDRHPRFETFQRVLVSVEIEPTSNIRREVWKEVGSGTIARLDSGIMTIGGQKNL